MTRLPAPFEADEQAALFRWAELQTAAYPELRLLYHIPNGSLRNKVVAARLKAQGVRAGAPDICLPIPRGEYGALYIELKRTQGGRVSKDQARWIEDLRRYGSAAMVCDGWESASKAILEYLHGEPPLSLA